MLKNTALAALSAVVALGFTLPVLADSTADSKMVQEKTMKNAKEAMPLGFDKCYGVVKAGKNDCASGANACAGQSKIDNDKMAWIALPKGTCVRIGGSITPS